MEQVEAAVAPVPFMRRGGDVLQDPGAGSRSIYGREEVEVAGRGGAQATKGAEPAGLRSGDRRAWRRVGATLGPGQLHPPAGKPPARQPAYVCDQGLVGQFLDLHYKGGFHSERVPDKRFQAHRSLASSLWVANPEEESRVPRCASSFQTSRGQTLSGRSPFLRSFPSLELSKAP